MTAADDLFEGLCRWLVGAQDDGGRLRDRIHGNRGSYAEGWAALALALHPELDRQAMNRSLALSFRQSLDSEFDTLAQWLLLRCAPQQLDPRQTSQIVDRPAVTPSGLVSNNWKILRGLTWALRYAQRPEASWLQEMRSALKPLEFQLPSGLYPDSPFGQASPVCYHAKICSCLGLMVSLCPSTTWEPLVAGWRLGLEALEWLVSPQGRLVPYGRSRNSLFAYASAYLALSLGGRFFQHSPFTQAAERVARHMRQFQSGDGHLPAVLNDREWLREDWDVYINNPDYNAYAAGCLGLARQLRAESPPSGPTGATSQGGRDLGPLWVYRRDDDYVAVSTTGEFAPEGTPFFCDQRYAPLHPLLVDSGGVLQEFATPYCWDGRDRTRSSLANPSFHPWIPYVEAGSRFYWTPCAEQVQRREISDASGALTGLELELTTHPLQLRPLAVWERAWHRRLGRVPQFHSRRASFSLASQLSLGLSPLKISKQSHCLEPGRRLHHAEKEWQR